MMDGEMIRFIRTEIERQMNVILSGVTANASEQYEDVGELFPSMPTITKRPVMHPYGLSSAAPDGTLQVVGKQGEHVGNRMILGHRDKDKPSCAPGETVLYDQFGGMIQLRTQGIEFTKNEVDLLEQLIKLITTILNARTNTLFGPQPLIPNPIGVLLGEDFTMIKTKLNKMKGGVSGN